MVAGAGVDLSDRPSILDDQDIVELLTVLASNQDLSEWTAIAVATASLVVALSAALIAYIPIRQERKRTERKILFTRIRWQTKLIQMTLVIGKFKSEIKPQADRYDVDLFMSEIAELSRECEYLTNTEQFYISKIYLYLNIVHHRFSINAIEGDGFDRTVESLEKWSDKFYKHISRLKIFPRAEKDFDELIK
jgi:hypothetical protein